MLALGNRIRADVGRAEVRFGQRLHQRPGKREADKRAGVSRYEGAGMATALPTPALAVARAPSTPLPRPSNPSSAAGAIHLEP